MLGYVGLDNAGMSGVEYAFEQEIRGRAAKIVVHTDARRRPVAQTERPSTEGATIVLALDEAVQHIAERELERSMYETQAASGMVIVVEPFSGEVLAMAARPGFNPNRYSSYPSSRWRNRAVSDVFEPGSIFKIVTAAAGLQEKVVGVDEVLDCGHGRIEIGTTVINDHAVFDQLTFRQAVAEVERHRHDPRGAAARPRRASRATCAPSASARRPASSCPASRRACCARPRSGAPSRCPRCPSARRSASPACR